MSAPGPPAEMCVLSSMVHGQNDTDTTVQVAVVAATAIAVFEPDLRALCYDLILAYLTLRSNLALLMKQRFGSVPEWAQERVSHAGLEQLERWLGKLLSASSLEELVQPDS